MPNEFCKEACGASLMLHQGLNTFAVSFSLDGWMLPFASPRRRRRSFIVDSHLINRGDAGVPTLVFFIGYKKELMQCTKYNPYDNDGVSNSVRCRVSLC